ncbi:hypothetical protein [Anabaena sp. UHCC 0399]|uniref:hypothetical protein n=1 Tax=Anabaena sp. UHCC 0399 TaxID=3110238 RepID=UPI002B1EEDE6|nr:hypothetical protein [Anabaena sp. UHCC 0399]MEA5564105.1 hypothetical protein [Anabaena sp. UHCC 0399]
MTISIEKRQFNNIATWMISTQKTNLPSVLKGVFFMDGNPAPDDCITMYNVEWDEQNNTLLLPVYAPLQWTFHNSIGGWILLRLIQLTRLTYKIQFTDATLQQAQITPIGLGIEIPRWLLNGTMHQNENSQGDTWERQNIWLGIIPKFADYTLRRIVDEEGCYTPAFEDMLTRVQKECLVIRNS